MRTVMIVSIVMIGTIDRMVRIERIRYIGKIVIGMIG